MTLLGFSDDTMALLVIITDDCLLTNHCRTDCNFCSSLTNEQDIYMIKPIQGIKNRMRYLDMSTWYILNILRSKLFMRRLLISALQARECYDKLTFKYSNSFLSHFQIILYCQ